MLSQVGPTLFRTQSAEYILHVYCLIVVTVSTCLRIKNFFLGAHVPNHIVLWRTFSYSKYNTVYMCWLSVPQKRYTAFLWLVWAGFFFELMDISLQAYVGVGGGQGGGESPP